MISVFRGLAPKAGWVVVLFFSFAQSSLALDLTLGNKTYQIELANTGAERRQGLMHRSELADDRGMLLVYPRAGDHRVWMKNMRIPIRVFWINASFEVIAVQRLEPCKTAVCTVYAASADSRFILELGDFEHDLRLGDRIDGLANL